MKQNLITDVIQGMLPYLNNAQTERLQEVLQHTLFDYEVTKTEKDKELSEQNLVESFLSAKRIEGCSEKTLKYYNATIQSMLDGIGKGIKYIVTDDIRCYLTEYQAKKKSSKVTIDNIRRILSSFFSWLEDEDYILKSPVRRIHKVKTGTNIKETYSDEALELMRDNCTELRDLAMIDMLASTGMRVGEMVLLNREATYEAMREAISKLSVKPDVLLNDAVKIPQVDIRQVPIIKGDAKSVSIAAASIVAKVTRDRLMEEYDKVLPGYGFASNKGYGSAEHIAALKEIGPSPIHRQSFIGHFV